MYLLGYDVGSSSVKASLINAESGRSVASAFYPKKEMKIAAPKPGWAEQDPDQWWSNLRLATNDVMQAALILIIQRPRKSRFLSFLPILA